MILSKDNEPYLCPKLILRSCTEQTELSNKFDSILMTRFCKKYNEDGTPNFITIAIDKIYDTVFVIEDFVELFENQKERHKMILDGDLLPVDWYGQANTYQNVCLDNVLPQDYQAKSSQKKLKGNLS